MLKNFESLKRIDQISDRAWLLILLTLGMLTHFAWPLSEPRIRIFDEGGFGPLVSTYLGDHRPRFDIHPPHAKMLTAVVARALGVHEDYRVDKDGNYAEDYPIVAMRFSSALCGILIPLLFFYLCRLAGAKGIAVALAGIGLCLDNAFISHTRIIAMDGWLVVTALTCFITYLYSRDRHPWAWLAVSGILAGLAFGSKFTGLAAAGFVTFLCLYLDRSPRRALLFTLCWVGVYLGGWWLHFHLLGIRGDYFDQLTSHHGEMFAFNFRIKGGHSSASPWWSWPIGGHAIWLTYANQKSPGLFLVEMDNLVLWIGTFVFCVLGIKEAIQKRDQRVGIWAAGYAICFLPFLFIGRFMFLYHYFLPFLLSLMVAVFWLENRLTARRFWDGVLILVIMFFLISPVTYSFPLPSQVRFAIVEHVPHFW